MFTISCSENNIGSNENNELTAAAVSKIYKACKYPNGEFCDKECCEAPQKCGSAEGYKKCDLDDGEWKENIYSDNVCNSLCAPEEIDKIKLDKNVTVQLQACSEGWKCLSKFERIYRNSNCSFGETERCSSGCVNDTCARLCNPGAFSCRNDVLRKCNEEGNNWGHYMTCDYRCENNTCTAAINQTTNQTQNIKDICDNKCFSITNFHYDAEGNDNNNENDEYVTIKNSCSFSCELAGWQISDNSSHTYSFASFNLGNGNSFTLYTGTGTDTPSLLYWNRGSAVWNNDGDILYLRNQNNELILTYAYP